MTVMGDGQRIEDVMIQCTSLDCWLMALQSTRLSGIFMWSIAQKENKEIWNTITSSRQKDRATKLGFRVTIHHRTSFRYPSTKKTINQSIIYHGRKNPPPSRYSRTFRVDFDFNGIQDIGFFLDPYETILDAYYFISY